MSSFFTKGGHPVLCALTIRRLKAGAYEQFRKAWEPEEWPSGFLRAYHFRRAGGIYEGESGEAEEIMSFAFFDTSGDVEAAIGKLRPLGVGERVARMRELVQSIEVDGYYELIEEVLPNPRAEL